MNTSQILGIAILALGAALLAFGYHASGAPIDQVSNALTGRYTDRTMWYVVGGVVAVVCGGVLAVVGKRI